MSSKTDKMISKNQLMRLPLYLNYLKKILGDGIETISSPIIAKDLH